MTPAETLRAAAALLRGRADRATGGPWRETPQSKMYGAIVGPATVRHPEVDGYGGAVVAESLTSADRDYLLCVHPEVGGLLADLLDAVAVRVEESGADVDGAPIAEAVLRGVQ